MQVKEKNWWSRNWKWVVPTGCLTSILLVVAFSFLIVALVFSFLKSSNPYQTALKAAVESPDVAFELGYPIEERWFLTGNINVSGASGHANLAIPLRGPKGTAKIYVIAEKSAGQWEYSTLVVEIKRTGKRIDLLAPAFSD